MKASTTILRLLLVVLTCLFSFGLAGLLMLGSMSPAPAWPYNSAFGSVLVAFSFTVGLVAWCLLLVMGIAWSFNKRVHKSIPIIGTVIGCLSLVPWLSSLIAMLVLSPAILLAIRLVPFHLRREQQHKSKWLGGAILINNGTAVEMSRTSFESAVKLIRKQLGESERIVEGIFRPYDHEGIAYISLAAAQADAFDAFRTATIKAREAGTRGSPMQDLWNELCTKLAADPRAHAAPT
ncbi:MAG: hypothetical protein V4857_15995 [Pseudomonadota bacterium]